MHVQIIPCLSDNYAYLLVDEASRKAVAIDPVDPGRVSRAIAEHELQLKYILTTHHHADHAGGNKGMLEKHPVPVLGGDERVDAVTQIVQHGHETKIGSVRIRAIHTPGHTTSHMSYFAEDAARGQRAVFTGDCLFVGGCGRFFEGTPEDMHRSLNTELGALPDDTKVYCGHEYTAENLKFALSVDGGNSALAAKADWAARQTCTMPSTIGEEKATNPFMRVADREIQAKCATVGDAVATMGRLRELKNAFK